MSLKINDSKIFTNFFTKIKHRQIDFIILHHIVAKNLGEAISLLKKHQVSSHYIIDQNGDIFNLVDDKNIAHHAGVSFWQDYDGLNQNSIGIEFFHPKPYQESFSPQQINSGIELCKFLKKKYNIIKDIIGHYEIAYFRDNGFLGRKDDPSYLFNWEKFYQNGLTFSRRKLQQDLSIFIKKFTLNQSDGEILQMKNKLRFIGYKVDFCNKIFDHSFMETVKVILHLKRL